MSNPFIKISAYKAWTGKNGNARPGCKPYDTDFYTEMNRIKDGYHKKIVEAYRSILDEKEKIQYKIGNLPSITISAVCKDWRKLENVVAHTGLLNLDIDGKANPHISDWGAVRDSIFQMKGVVACFLSVSGNGCTFVVKVNPDQHKDTFFSIVDGMKQHFNINVDPGLHDVTRLRFVSDDPGCKIRYNFDEIPVSQPSAEYLENKKHFGSSDITLEPIGDADSEYNFNEAVKRAEGKYSFTEGQKWSFLVSVAGSCNIMGMSEKFCSDMVLTRFKEQTKISIDRILKPIKDVYKLYRSQHGTYDIEAAFERLNRKVKNKLIYEYLHEGKQPSDDEIVEIAKECEANIDRVSYVMKRVFSEYAEEFGYNQFPPVKKVQIWLSKRWEFRFNKVLGQPEMASIGTKEAEQVNPDEIFRQLHLNHIKYPLNNVKSLIRSDFLKPYDPILDYFNSLTYDGSKDYIEELANHITTAEGEYWPKMFRKALIRCVACGLGRKENRIVMVLYGKKQETGKSTFIRFLSPFPDGKYFTESPIIGGNQKDTEIRFSENFIYNLEELAGLSRVDVNKLKADISKTSIKERRAYAMFEQSAPRRCNFWASTNQKEFLHDEENTRWLIFEVTGINWGYRSTIDINKVWAQAYHLYKQGESGELDAQDKEMRDYLNDDYRYRRPEEELLARHFRVATPTTGQFFSATEIAIILNQISPSLRVNPNNIGKSMVSIFNLESVQVKINGRNTRGYWLHNSYSEADGERRSGFTPVTGNTTF